MREPLVLAVAQPPCVSHDVAANALAHAAAVRSAHARVVAFPELSLTGYELDTDTITADDPRLAPLVEACADTGAVALAGAPVRGTADRVHIGTLAVDGAGAGVVYRKQWLGPAETARFTPGERPAVLEVDGWRLGLAICKDTGVPRHAADTAALGMDVYVAAVLEHAHEIDIQTARARRVATGHGAWVAVASFAGSTGGGYTTAAGRSSIRRRDGTVLVQAGPEPGEVATATLAH